MALSSYYVGFLVKEDTLLRRRVAACAQQQSDLADADIGDPEEWAAAHSWEYAMAPEWVAKAESAIVAGVQEWGADPAVISDQDILSWTQPQIVPAP